MKIYVGTLESQRVTRNKTYITCKLPMSTSNYKNKVFYYLTKISIGKFDVVFWFSFNQLKNRNTQTTQLVALINYDDCIFEFLTTPNKGIIIVYLHFPNEAKYCTSTKKGFLFLQGASASVKCKHSCLL